MNVNDDKNETVPCFLFCGNPAEEGHHVAGRVNGPDFTVPLCKKCHLKLTRLQRAAEVDLSHSEKPFPMKLESILISVGLFLITWGIVLIKKEVVQCVLT